MAEKKQPKDERVVAGSPEEGLPHGVWGVETDPTPNENYSVQGVTSQASTPETDEQAARAAAKSLQPDHQAGVRG